MIASLVVASLDRKRLGADFWGGAGTSIRGVFDEETRRKPLRQRRPLSCQPQVSSVDRKTAHFSSFTSGVRRTAAQLDFNLCSRIRFLIANLILRNEK